MKMTIGEVIEKLDKIDDAIGCVRARIDHDLYDALEKRAESMEGPILRETMTIMVNGKPSIAYKDEIEKELYKHLYSGLGLRYGC